MTLDLTVARRYAQALFNLSQKQGITAELEELARRTLPLTAPHAPLAKFLQAPHIAKSKKRDLVQKVIADKIPTLLDEFILLLIDRGRADHLHQALLDFVRFAEESRDVYPAEVATAVPLTDEQRQRLQDVLQAHTGHTLAIEFCVEPSLLGGVVFRYRDELIDGSIRGSLKEIGALLRPLRVH